MLVSGVVYKYLRRLSRTVALLSRENDSYLLCIGLSGTMLGAIVLIAIVGASLAQDDQCCSIEDRREVAAMWNDIWSSQFTGRRVKLAQAVFTDLFETVPAARGLFERVNVADENSPEFKAHCIRVVNGLDECINLLHDPATLRAELDHLNEQHVARKGVGQSHFREFGNSFAKVMPQVSSCFNSDAWGRCFNYIAAGIYTGLPE